eukprot:CAMPEP_0206527412 /NCGR_PEP_ID=MMETSP0325_2-20121206/1329_1 /ASSEMBLY_ACC=CAM_ASM_000347 /TAXON_ID=2866 /ORGANISM="Crypthecodinium cohnii, Strain Seligo" /LENGTH=728 /DNA_ID=CAMNT_0054022809 /DNA_START=116 /DNA_END=2303 /DNA_ORIENTATION=+
MTARLRNLLLRKSALEPLHCSDESSGEEQEDWIAGSRYQALRDIPLFSRQEPRSEACGTIPRGSVVLVMVLQPHEDELGEAVMAYIADTKIPGWTTISREGWSRPVLGFRRLTGSWELGGRYRVLESLVLRAGMELDSESLCELSKREEVLVLDMGLVLRDGQPRLRAKVRTDSGALGWLTMELPSGPPMLDSMNLLSVRAVKPGCFSKGASSRVARMRPRASVSHERNEVFRAMSSAQLRHDVELNSSSLGTLKKGALATVQDLRRVQWHPNVEGTLRLKVVVGNSSSSTASPPVVGWISAFDGTGEPILDFRDQLEYQKILTLLAPGQDVHSIVVKVHRSQEDGGQKPVGIIVDKSDERSLVVAGFAEDGLMAAWNDRQSNPEDRVRPGDRVVSVNGVIGDRTLLLEQMSAQSLELVIRRDKGASVTSAELRAVHEDEHDLEHADAALTRSIFDHPDDNKSPGSKGSESEHRGRARTADFGPDSDTGSPDSFCRTSSPLCERQQPETLGVEARATDPTYRRPSNSQCYLGQLSERSEAAVISETSVLHHAFGNSSASGPGDGDSQTEERGDYMETGRELLQQHQQQQQQQPEHGQQQQQGQVMQLSSFSSNNPFTNIADPLLRALQELRRVSTILRECMSFWTNMDGTVKELSMLRDNMQTLVKYTSANPKIKERFDQRLGEYYKFWDSLIRLCQQYCMEVEPALARAMKTTESVELMADRIDARA